MSTPTIVFFGTPEFAVPTLERLHREWSVAAVVTAPNTPSGRGRKLTPPPVKQAAERLGIMPIVQPLSPRDEAFHRWLAALSPDILCVLGYRILPATVLSCARLAFNVHPSLLPRHRGPAPIAHTIIAGDHKTGATTFILSNRVDAGMILLQQEIDIPDGLTAGDLAQVLAPLCAELACQTIQAWCDGTLRPFPQDETQATYAPKLHPETAWIDWSMDVYSVRNRIHGYSPEPGAWTVFDGARLKIFRARIVTDETESSIPGHWEIKLHQWLVNCGSGMLELVEIQLPGRKRVSTEQFLRGWRGKKEGVCTSPEKVSV